MLDASDTKLRPGRSVLGTTQLSLLALGVGLVLAACSNPGTAHLATAGVPAARVSLERALDVMLRPSSETAAETFLASLPEPIRVQDQKVTNPQDPRWQDTVRTLQYDGLELTVYRVQSTGSRFPMAVRVTSPAYQAPNGLRVGLGRADVLAILGEPTAHEGATWVYRIDAPMSAPYELLVQLQDGRVIELHWIAYLD